MKINFVTEPAPGWVLRWISESYAKRLPDAKVSTEPDNNCDINVYVNYDLFKGKTNTIDVGYFTHKESVYPDEAYIGMSQEEVEFTKKVALERAKKFDDVAKEVDWCIAMNRGLLRELPEGKSSVILVPPDPQFMKEKIVIGWVGRTSKTGRKSLNWLEEIKKIDGIEVKTTEGNYKWEELPDFYRSIDYLLVYSHNEGGPLPLVEALAMGVPVISPDVGFAPEYTTIRYNGLEDLKKILSGLVIKKDAWENSAQEMLELFKNLCLT